MAVDTIVRVDPGTLLVGPNARKEVDLDVTFLGLIKEHGVRVPIIAVETPEGLVVVDGQRRTLAALDQGLTEVPVFVTATQSDAERLVEQIVVNESRQGLSKADGIAAVQDLALFNMAVPAIAEKTGLSEKFVSRAVKVGSSAAAKKAIADGKLDFDTAVTIADFDEFPKEQEQLLKLVKNGQSWNVSSKARELQDARGAKAVEEAIKASGVTMISAPDRWRTNDPKSVEDLYTDAEMTKDLEKVAHKKLVELAGDGLRAFATTRYVNNERAWVIGYAVAGWKDRGLFGHENASGSSAPATPEDAEKLRAERRVAREHTKAWVAASALRIEFLQGLVQRKTLPKGWEALVIGRMLSVGSHGTMEWRLAHVILGIPETTDSYSLSSTIRDYAKKNPTKALHVGLAVYLSSIEGGFEFDKKGWSQNGAKEYLELLESWGYQLTEIEQLAAKRIKKLASAA